MAKQYKTTSLPKVISKANKDIATIIENDIASESQILKNLVDQVLSSNMEVKKRSNKRITETKRKLEALDIEIDELNKSIDIVDRETVVEQLNEMIDAENNIFSAKNNIRFFDNEYLPKQLENIDLVYKQLDQSINSINVQVPLKTSLKEQNEKLYNKHLELSYEIIHHIKATLLDKKSNVFDAQVRFKNLQDTISETENTFNDYVLNHIKEFIDLEHATSSVFSIEDNDDLITEQLINNHKKIIDALEESLLQKEKEYLEKEDFLVSEYKKFENEVKNKYEEEFQQELEKERLLIEKKDEELKNIKLLIIDAEKKQDIAKMQKLMKQYDKVEKTKDASVTEKTDKQFLQQTKKQKEKVQRELIQNNLDKITTLNKLEHEIALEKINFEEGKILHKIKADYDGLYSDLELNKAKRNKLTEFLSNQEKVLNTIYDLKLKLRLQELEVMKDNELLENNLLEQFKQLLISLKDIEYKRKEKLFELSNQHESIRIEQYYHVQKAILDLKLSRTIEEIDKQIVTKQNESIIKIEKLKEQANSDIIYQESLIKIAKKERELQLVKVNSLYENERSLAEEQIERIETGVEVNETFIKTTLENQLLFASQQIKCAESEYDIRVESITLTKEQELHYAYKKIDQYRQKYEYEKSKLLKERDDRLEDLQFKLLLFTEKKDNEQIQEQINTLTSKYQLMIDEIEAKEKQDKEIIRYEKVIEKIETRALQAMNEALALKEQTIDSFQVLYDQTKSKFEQINQSTKGESTSSGIVPLLNSSAVSSADARLKQAIAEADELYQERIIAPQEIIKEKQEYLLKMTKESNTDDFILNQNKLKEAKIKEHNEAILLLQKNKEKQLNEIMTEIDLSDELNKDIDYINSLSSFRTNKEIEEDYKTVIAREKTLNQKKILEFKTFKKDTLTQQQAMFNQNLKAHKATLAQYKKYMKSASRGLNQEKRQLQASNKKVLKKKLAIAKENYILPI
jgi:hypothetical protein